MSTAPPPPTTITIRPPSRYASSTTSIASPPPPPPLDWLRRTWTFTHSTLKMWRTAQNVRITYGALDDSGGSAPPRLDDRVEYESNAAGRKGVRAIEGVDTAVVTADTDTAGTGGAWVWRGKRWLRFVTSEWAVLGWGERPLAGGDGVERWCVTWFAPTLFSKEGVDFYSDRREGLSPETAAAIQAALEAVPAAALVDLVKGNVRPVDIKLPWQES